MAFEDRGLEREGSDDSGGWWGGGEPDHYKAHNKQQAEMQTLTVCK